MSLPVGVRHALYITASVVGILAPVAVSLHLIDPIVGEGLLKLVALFGGVAGGTAAVVLGKQRKDQTLDFHGTAAEQAIAAIQAVSTQVAAANADVARVRNAVEEAVQDIPILGPLARQALG